MISSFVDCWERFMNASKRAHNTLELIHIQPSLKFIVVKSFLPYSSFSSYLLYLVNLIVS